MSIVGHAIRPELMNQEARPVLMMRERTTIEQLPIIIGECYRKIMNYLNELEVTPIDAPYTAYLNLDMHNLYVEIGFPVSKIFPDKGKIKARKIPECRVVSMMYKGSYSDMSIAYDEMLKWMEGNGYEDTGIYYEYYYNSPIDVPENELLTRIVIPIK
jgi:effector-binding domain-containing protein